MLEKSIIQKLNGEVLERSCVEVDMLRIDLIHPVISGNKLFKLKYYLTTAIAEQKNGIVTCGGAFSNHLVAAAFAAKEKGLSSIGYVRAESHETLTPTLKECIMYGMELRYCARSDFNLINQAYVEKIHPNYRFIPQGGYGFLGAKGAADILNDHKTSTYTHILAVCGTGTMGAGLINSAEPNQEIILISALKNNFSIQEEIHLLLTDEGKTRNQKILFHYHMGGYAKKNNEVLATMNHFFKEQGIPTDFVYTGKMIQAFYDLLKNNFFEPGSKILLIHSGGLQGNRSLNKDELIF